MGNIGTLCKQGFVKYLAFLPCQIRSRKHSPQTTQLSEWISCVFSPGIHVLSFSLVISGSKLLRHICCKSQAHTGSPPMSKLKGDKHRVWGGEGAKPSLLSHASLIQLAPLFAVQGVALFVTNDELIAFQSKLLDQQSLKSASTARTWNRPTYSYF